MHSSALCLPVPRLSTPHLGASMAAPSVLVHFLPSVDPTSLHVRVTWGASETT